MNILITICARGGSKGIPGKNIKIMNEVPLINYTISLAKKVQKKYSAIVTLSTDDIEIKNVAEVCGLTTEYERPYFLATDEAGKIDTIRDVLKYEEEARNLKFDFILDLDVTSPLRNIEDIETALDLLTDKPDAKNLFSVNVSARNPYFNMVQEDNNGFFSLVNPHSDLKILSRQSAPKVYDLNASFYWYRRSFFDSYENSAITDKSLAYEMKHICFDLDHPLDFLFMEYLIQNNKLDFSL